MPYGALFLLARRSPPRSIAYMPRVCFLSAPAAAAAWCVRRWYARVARQRASLILIFHAYWFWCALRFAMPLQLICAMPLRHAFTDVERHCWCAQRAIDAMPPALLPPWRWQLPVMSHAWCFAATSPPFCFHLLIFRAFCADMLRYAMLYCHIDYTLLFHIICATPFLLMLRIISRLPISLFLLLYYFLFISSLHYAFDFAWFFLRCRAIDFDFHAFSSFRRCFDFFSSLFRAACLRRRWCCLFFISLPLTPLLYAPFILAIHAVERAFDAMLFCLIITSRYFIFFATMLIYAAASLIRYWFLLIFLPLMLHFASSLRLFLFAARLFDLWFSPLLLMPFHVACWLFADAIAPCLFRFHFRRLMRLSLLLHYFHFIILPDQLTRLISTLTAHDRPPPTFAHPSLCLWARCVMLFLARHMPLFFFSDTTFYFHFYAMLSDWFLMISAIDFYWFSLSFFSSRDWSLRFSLIALMFSPIIIFIFFRFFAFFFLPQRYA